MIGLPTLLHILVLNIVAKDLHEVSSWLIASVVGVAHLQHYWYPIRSLLQDPILIVLVGTKALLVNHLVHFTFHVLDLLVVLIEQELLELLTDSDGWLLGLNQVIIRF